MEHVMEYRIERIQKEEVTAGFYRLFWIYVICGVAGFFIFCEMYSCGSCI